MHRFWLLLTVLALCNGYLNQRSNYIHASIGASADHALYRRNNNPVARFYTPKLEANRKGKVGESTSLTPTELHIERVSNAIIKNSDKIISGLSTNKYAVVDNLLGTATLIEMRKEAELLYKNGNMIVSQSTKYDRTSRDVISYDKKNVYSCQLMGSEMYFHAPRLHEYIYSLSKTIIPLINDNFKFASLSNTMSSTKLAVCTGDGSRYDKHYDNTGSDSRKLTILYYLNPKWHTELHGEFRIYQTKSDMKTIDTHDIEPIGDRLLCFWADELVHSVQESFCFNTNDHRYALTLWLFSTSNENIVVNQDEVKLHFPELNVTN